MSADNKYFLFYNRLTKKILVYKLNKIFENQDVDLNSGRCSYEF